MSGNQISLERAEREAKAKSAAANIAGRKPLPEDRIDDRILAMTTRIADTLHAIMGPGSAKDRREFEERVERQLQNGSKFVLRKRSAG